LALATFLAGVSLSLTGCGIERDVLGRKKSKSDQTVTPDAAPGHPTSGSSTPSPEDIELGKAIERTLPIETFLLGLTELPPRLKANSLTLSFRSNASQAAFECRVAVNAPWAPCPMGNKFRFAALRHGQTIALWVRAKGADGRADLSPLQIGSLVDLQDGVTVANAMEEAAEERPLVRADQLPVEMDQEPSNGSLDVAERKVQVGSFYGVVVPWEMFVATYSTSKTYNSSLQILRVLGRNAGAAYDGERCDREFERVVAGPAPTRQSPQSLQYCEATPGRQQLDQSYARPMPYNHVELVVARDFGEKILVAAFDSDPDPYEVRLGIDHICRNAGAAGSQAVPVLNEFFGVEPAREMLSWCQVRSVNGSFWWVGIMTASLSSKPDAPRVRVIYSVNADRGILSGQQFASRAAAVLTKVIVPIAAVPE